MFQIYVRFNFYSDLFIDEKNLIVLMYFYVLCIHCNDVKHLQFSIAHTYMNIIIVHRAVQISVHTYMNIIIVHRAVQISVHTYMNIISVDRAVQCKYLYMHI